MTTVVHSVPHTGTHMIWLIVRELLRPGDETLKPIENIDGVEFCHVGDVEPQPHWRIIMPVRDPLAQAISCRLHGNRFDIGRWRKAVDIGADTGQFMTWVPFDPARPTWDRIVDDILNIASALHRAVPSDRRVTVFDRWDDLRQAANARGTGHHLTQALQEGRLDDIERVMPQEVADLRGAEPWLRPWLERRGYRNLIWWSERP